ncbi:MAG: hypothetical protein R3B40_32480 [Polyangiales bacterium]|nr:hypothetical protein [Myxococcales bacterium]
MRVAFSIVFAYALGVNAPQPPSAPLGPGPSAPDGAGIPQRPPPGSGGVANNKVMLGVLAGCGCLMLLVIVGVMVGMVYVSRRNTASQSAAPTTPPLVSPAATTPAASGTPPATAAATSAGDVERAATDYLLALGQSVLTAARGEYGDPRFGAPHASAVPSVAALGASPTVRMVVVALGASAGRTQHVRTVMVAFPDGRLRAAEAKLGTRPSGGRFDAAAAPELFALVGHLSDGLLQQGRCPTLLSLPELAGLPQPLIADLTRELGESRIECQGLRSWPGFHEAWEAHSDELIVIADGGAGPVVIEAQLRAQRGVLTPSRIRERRDR